MQQSSSFERVFVSSSLHIMIDRSANGILSLVLHLNPSLRLFSRVCVCVVKVLINGGPCHVREGLSVWLANQ